MEKASDIEVHMCFTLGKKKNNKCVYGHMLKKNLGRSVENNLFLNFIFYNKIDVGWHLESISRLEEWYLTRFVKIMIP